MADNKDEMKDQEDEETPEEEEASEQEAPEADAEPAAAGDELSTPEQEASDAEEEPAAAGDELSTPEEEPADEEVGSARAEGQEAAEDEQPAATATSAPSLEPAEGEAEPHEPPPEAKEVEESEVASSASVAAEAPAGAGPLEGVAAFFEHPKHLLAAATYARDSDYVEFDAYSPFPIHGMDEAMGLGRSWIPWVTFGAGLTGFILANLLQFGMMTFDWPMIIGGKPYAPWPSFVPIMFELTVLLAGVTTAVVMLKAAGCFQKPLIIDPSITDDRFVLWVSAKDDKFDVDEVIEFLEDLHPLEVRKIVKDA